MEKNIDSNYTRMQRAILNKSWRQHPTKPNCTATYLPSRKLSKLEESGMQNIAREAVTSSWVMFSNGPRHMIEQKQDDQLKPTYSSSVRIRDVALRTYQKR